MQFTVCTSYSRGACTCLNLVLHTREPSVALECSQVSSHALLPAAYASTVLLVGFQDSGGAARPARTNLIEVHVSILPKAFCFFAFKTLEVLQDQVEPVWLRSMSAF